MKTFIPTLMCILSFALGVEYVLSIRRVGGQVSHLTEMTKKMEQDIQEIKKKES